MMGGSGSSAAAGGLQTARHSLAGDERFLPHDGAVSGNAAGAAPWTGKELQSERARAELRVTKVQIVLTLLDMVRELIAEREPETAV
jgi:hypothetical protein